MANGAKKSDQSHDASGDYLYTYLGGLIGTLARHCTATCYCGTRPPVCKYYWLLAKDLISRHASRIGSQFR